MQHSTPIKKRLSGSERREQILNAALTLFAEKGFSGTKTKKVAETAGISETLVFQHFKTKEALYRAAIAHLFSPHPVIPEIEKKAKKKDDHGLFLSLALHMITHAREDPRIVRLAIFSALEGSRFFSAIKRDEPSTPDISEFLAGYIRQRIEDGAFKEINPRIAARLFMESVFMHSAEQVVFLTGPPLEFPVEETVETMVTLFLGGLRAQPETLIRLPGHLGSLFKKYKLSKYL